MNRKNAKIVYPNVKVVMSPAAELMRTKSQDTTSLPINEIVQESYVVTNEKEIMGESGNGRRSETMEKNLNQMVKVLHNRLNSLENACKTRIRLCEEDSNPLSKKMSKNAPKIFDEFDELMPRSLKDAKQQNLVYKDNLVSSDTVYIDPYHLVLKTKIPTDAAKKLENNLDEAFGITNLRELKSKKTKNGNEKSKKSEQLKNEAKRMNRLNLEKKLQINMDAFVTRSVTEVEFIFFPPEDERDEAAWPIPVKWSKRDDRHQNVENIEGQFDPDLLLQYAIERINLPSGVNLFCWIVRQAMVQRYLVVLFWFIKVKFFESSAALYGSEAYLLYHLSKEYKALMDFLGEKSRAEHEKDFVYKYYPFILTNAVYFAFYYLYPGSRHLYSKGSLTSCVAILLSRLN
jgi:hypothetical protein